MVIAVGCTVIRAGQAFNVPHGDFFVNVDDCERCLCNNGEATMCEPSVCTALQRSPPTCDYEGQSYTHGETFQVTITLLLSERHKQESQYKKQCMYVTACTLERTRKC